MLASDNSSDVAAAAAKDRDLFLEEAREGLKRVAGFAVNTSACKSEATCKHAKEEQQKSLGGLEASARAVSQHSKKAAQKACKYAIKAGVSEHISEHARVAAERKAEDLIVEVEHQKDKAQARIEDAFETAKKQMVKASKETQASKANMGEASEDQKSGLAPIMPGATVKPVDLFSALPPLVMAEVAACNTRHCVEGWHEKTQAEMKQYTPKEYQHFAMAAIKKEYAKNLARVTKEADAPPDMGESGAEELGSKVASSRTPVMIAIFFMVSASALLFVFRSHVRRQSGSLEHKLLETDLMHV
jgi:hypothetical protein